MKTQLVPIADNLTEVLLFILDFTQRRHKILIENLNNVNCVGYVPKDLMVDEFARCMDRALAEHIKSGRLAMEDSENIRFGSNGQFLAFEKDDEVAHKLFENDVEKYLELQKRKLSENSFNSRLAAELLRKKQRNETVC